MMLRIKNKGFMIIEMIVATAIIVFAVVGPLSAVKSSLMAATDSKDNIQSVYLADEIMEYVRLVRDNNLYGGRGWLNGLNTCQASSGCGITPSTGTVVSCSSESNCELYYDKNTGRFYHASMIGRVKTGITRIVYISETVNSREARVTVVIKRNRLSFPERVYTMTGILSNWKQQI